ncbi:mitochondrial enolase superfamily member 1-like [Lineus longissimus]|uniref:mitochondrial enolase superfamily member 1-like n=1 Tax=Lineus longissimus TaxID=88925 RepID=UPI002B4ED101
MAVKILSLDVKDIRFPTSLQNDGSDAMHTDPDYSCAYVTLATDSEHSGFGHTFTIGRGTEIVCEAVEILSRFVVGQVAQDIFDNFGEFYRKITNDTQLRWIGPEKGVVHLAAAAVLNALWDLWGKMENKPVWKLLVDMEPEKLVSLIDFRWLSDSLTKEEALELLRKGQDGKQEREDEMRRDGYPAYTTSAGWLGYNDDKIRQLLRDAQADGFKRFKFKVGANLEEDIRRLRIVRDEIGYDIPMMTDANQRWDVDEAIHWMKQLAEFKPLWIEEPTSPDDVLGHLEIAKALNPLGIKVATGEMCQNKVMFKQFLKSGAMQFCQIDSCRVASVNENLAIMLMAQKYNVPVCPHAGGVGLCELVQHLSFFYYICISRTLENRMTEFANHLHEHYKDPVVIKNSAYQMPLVPGYSGEMFEDSARQYEYPNGPVWQKLFQEGKATRPVKYLQFMRDNQ